MSMHGLIKASSLVQRTDTIQDLWRVNQWRQTKGLQPIMQYGPSVRALENSIALSLEKADTADLPKLLRSESFYRSCLPEITEKERNKYSKINP